MKKVIILSLVIMMANVAFADLKVLNSVAEFEKTIREAKVPVVVKFSNYL